MVNGEEIIIAKAGKPIMLTHNQPNREMGQDLSDSDRPAALNLLTGDLIDP